MWVVPLETSNGVSVVQAGLEKFTRPLPAKTFAAAPGDGVDDAAAEAAELGGDAGRQHLRLLDRVFDEQVLRLREQVVVDVDAVDHEHVVEGERAVDDDLADAAAGRALVRRVLIDAGRRAARCPRSCAASPAPRSPRA